MTKFAVLDGDNYTSETVDLPTSFVMRGYVNLEKYPLPKGKAPLSFDFEVAKWVLDSSPTPVSSTPSPVAPVPTISDKLPK